MGDSFHVFERTTAAVQYAIETVERDLLRCLFLEGLDEAEAQLASVERQVEDEQARIDKVDSLDALARQETDDVEFVGAVRAQERESGSEFARSTMGVLNLHAEDLRADVASRGAGAETVTLARTSPPLRIYNYKRVAGRPLNVTASRSLAVTQDSLSLLGPGASLVEALRLHQDWDDTAQTACVWCEDRSISDAHAGLRCEFLVRADPSESFGVWTRLETARPRDVTGTRTDADAPLAIAGLQRRLDAYLPPTLIALWFDFNAELIVESDAVARFEQALNAPGKHSPWAEETWDESRAHNWSRIPR